jgi:hypothetical protein
MLYEKLKNLSALISSDIVQWKEWKEKILIKCAPLSGKKVLPRALLKADRRNSKSKTKFF